MPPSIHPVHLVTVLRQKSLTPAIVFLTSRRSCDEALQAFEHATDPLSPARQESITAVLDELTATYPSLQDHPLRKMVTACGVAAHHAGHLPSWKIAIEELMRRGCLDAVFATTTLAAGVDFPARTVVLTQSGVRRDQDFTDLTIAEVAQISGRAGRRGKDIRGRRSMPRASTSAKRCRCAIGGSTCARSTGQSAPPPRSRCPMPASPRAPLRLPRRCCSVRRVSAVRRR